MVLQLLRYGLNLKFDNISLGPVIYRLHTNKTVNYYLLLIHNTLQAYSTTSIVIIDKWLQLLLYY